MLAGLTLSAAVLLAAAGLAKLARPAAAGRALATSLGLGRHRALPARLAGCAELAAAGCAATVGGRLGGAAVAATFLALAAVAELMRRRNPGAGCGCFGASDTPATGWHVAVNLGFAAVGTAAAALAAPSPVDEIRGAPAAGAGLVVSAAALAGLAYATLSAFPSLLRATADSRSGS